MCPLEQDPPVQERGASHAQGARHVKPDAARHAARHIARRVSHFIAIGFDTSRPRQSPGGACRRARPKPAFPPTTVQGPLRLPRSAAPTAAAGAAAAASAASGKRGAARGHEDAVQRFPRIWCAEAAGGRGRLGRAPNEEAAAKPTSCSACSASRVAESRDADPDLVSYRVYANSDQVEPSREEPRAAHDNQSWRGREGGGGGGGRGGGGGGGGGKP